MAVGFSRREEDAVNAEGTARDFLARVQRLQGLENLAPDTANEVWGLEGFEILRAQALLELGRRVGAAGRGNPETIEGPGDVMELLDYLRGEKREHFVAVLLDAKNNVLRVAEVHIGTLTMSVVGAREVFREAVREGASSVIVAHNHPSGDPTPSPEDIEVTKELVKAGVLLDIPVLDHVVIGDRRYISLHDRNLM